MFAPCNNNHCMRYMNIYVSIYQGLYCKKNNVTQYALLSITFRSEAKKINVKLEGPEEKKKKLYDKQTTHNTINKKLYIIPVSNKYNNNYYYYYD